MDRPRDRAFDMDAQVSARPEFWHSCRVDGLYLLAMTGSTGVRRGRHRQWIRVALALARGSMLAILALPMHAARADIYGFVDELGVPHLASERLDERYSLFKKEPGPALKTVGPEMLEIDGPGRTPVNAAERRRYTPLIAAVARELRVDPALLHAVVAVESGYNARARSPRGAMGLMQLMPDTARRYEVENVWDPRENLRGGARYLRELLALFGQDLTLTLAAYNAGEAAVARYGNAVPPYPETRDYVPRVLGLYRSLTRTPNADPVDRAGAAR